MAEEYTYEQFLKSPAAEMAKTEEEKIQAYQIIKTWKKYREEGKT